jgi:hypothetical protein
MRVTKALVGKQVRIRWMDPRSFDTISHFPIDHRDIQKGRALLATWEEWGTIDDITDGVIRLIQSVANDPPEEALQNQAITHSAIPEVLIENITILEDKPGVDVGTPAVTKETP